MAQPTNINYLSPTGFRLVFDKLPTVTYMCTSADLPSLTMAEAAISTPANILYEPGDKMFFEPFNVRFKVDEDLVNYIEIFDWMVGLGWPEETQQHTSFVTYTNNGLARTRTNVFSDCTLQVLTSHKNLNKKFVFHDAFPNAITPITFDSTVSDIDYIECDLTIRYRDFIIV